MFREEQEEKHGNDNNNNNNKNGMLHRNEEKLEEYDEDEEYESSVVNSSGLAMYSSPSIGYGGADSAAGSDFRFPPPPSPQQHQQQQQQQQEEEDHEGNILMSPPSHKSEGRRGRRGNSQEEKEALEEDDDDYNWESDIPSPPSQQQQQQQQAGPWSIDDDDDFDENVEVDYDDYEDYDEQEEDDEGAYFSDAELDIIQKQLAKGNLPPFFQKQQPQKQPQKQQQPQQQQQQQPQQPPPPQQQQPSTPTSQSQQPDEDHHPYHRRYRRRPSTIPEEEEYDELPDAFRSSPSRFDHANHNDDDSYSKPPYNYKFSRDDDSYADLIILDDDSSSNITEFPLPNNESSTTSKQIQQNPGRKKIRLRITIAFWCLMGALAVCLSVILPNQNHQKQQQQTASVDQSVPNGSSKRGSPKFPKGGGGIDFVKVSVAPSPSPLLSQDESTSSSSLSSKPIITNAPSFMPSLQSSSFPSNLPTATLIPSTIPSSGPTISTITRSSGPSSMPSSSSSSIIIMSSQQPSSILTQNNNNHNPIPLSANLGLALRPVFSSKTMTTDLQFQLTLVLESYIMEHLLDYSQPKIMDLVLSLSQQDFLPITGTIDNDDNYDDDVLGKGYTNPGGGSERDLQEEIWGTLILALSITASLYPDSSLSSSSQNINFSQIVIDLLKEEETETTKTKSSSSGLSLSLLQLIRDIDNDFFGSIESGNVIWIPNQESSSSLSSSSSSNDQLPTLRPRSIMTSTTKTPTYC